MAKKLDLKKVFLQRGEMIGLSVAGVVGAALLVTSLFLPGRGLFSVLAPEEGSSGGGGAPSMEGNKSAVGRLQNMFKQRGGGGGGGGGGPPMGGMMGMGMGAGKTLGMPGQPPGMGGGDTRRKS